MRSRDPDEIIASLEQGVRPWIKPWDAEQAVGRINILMLWAASIEQGLAAPMRMTFKQALELDSHVKKGEKGSLVVYANTITYYAKPEPKMTGPERIANDEQFFANTGADIRYRGTRAFYAIEPDYIAMPPIEAFGDAETLYATLAHETTHWTRHSSRLERDFGNARPRAMKATPAKKLVAELGSAFLCSDIELTPVVRDARASYLASWLEVLKNDKRAIFQAAFATLS